MAISALLILFNILIFTMAVVMMSYAARLQRSPSIRWLLLLTFSFCVVSFCTLNIYVNEDFTAKVLFSRYRFLGLSLLSPSWLLFTSAVYGRWLWIQKKWVTMVIFAPGLINVFFTLIPAFHELVIKDYQSISYLSVDVLKYTGGKWFPVYYFWSVFLILVSLLLSAHTYIQVKNFRRKQVIALTAGSVIAAGIDIYCVLTSSPLRWLMVASGTFLFSQLGIVYAVLRHRLLNVVPLAMAKVFQRFPDPVLVIDDQQKLVAANDVALNFFGLRKNFSGRRLADCLGDLVLVPGEVTLKDQQHNDHYFHLSFERLETDIEDAPGQILFFREITLQKSIEHRLNENVEFKARLLVLIAHDLTGHLGSHALLSQSLQEEVEPHFRERMELLTDSAMASQGLVNNVMSWVKTQSTRFVKAHRPFEWNMLVAENLELMQPQLRLKKIEVIVQSNSKPLLAEGDSDMLSSVFRNVLANSVRATRAGGNIYIDLTADSNKVRLSVRDQGVGMTAEQLQSLRIQSANFAFSGISGGNGSGIGLMMSRQFIELHGGTFRIDSELGIGTEVRIDIPL